MRDDFPFLRQHVNGHPIVYVDNAATTQKPHVVLDALMKFYTTCNANVHRGIYTHAECATGRYEAARATVAQFIGAQPAEIVFTRGATEGINVVAASWALQHLSAHDEIVITELEHHANILPWMHVAEMTGARLVVVPIEKNGTLDSGKVCEAITRRTKLVCLVHMSHVTGAWNDVQKVAQRAHDVGAYILVDAAQSIAHRSINVRELGVDFLVFSGHKIMGPTGIGVLYVAQHLHEQMVPYQWGGGMVKRVQLPAVVEIQAMPYVLEAGTPAIAQAVGLAAAIDYMRTVDMAVMQQHEASLCAYFINGVAELTRVHCVGPLDELAQSGSLVSFWVEGVHAHDVAYYLDRYGIAVRAGNHCAQPLIDALGGRPLVRVSFFWYNTVAEVEHLLICLKRLLCDFS